MNIEDLLKPRFQSIHFSDIDLPEGEEGPLNIFSIDATRIHAKKDLLSAVAREFRFPSYFGGNWDALDECLRDLSWLEKKASILLVRHADALWRNHAFQAGKLCEIWLSAAEEWARENVPFHLIFLMKDPSDPDHSI